ncbi:MAG: tryptophan synthase subunit beta [archaeon]
MARYGEYGGQYVSELLIPVMKELEQAYLKHSTSREFKQELELCLKEYVGRPSPLYHAKALSEEVGCKVYLKREDLNHTGAHKINNVMAQGLLAKKMGKTRLIAETGAGQHGVATATAAAFFGMECDVYMGSKDVERQSMNVHRMELLGAKVVPVDAGSRTLKDAINEALRDYAASSEYTHYLIGTVVGPHPYPMMVRDFQSVIGKEARAQILEKEGRLPTRLFACAGGGSNAMGLFYPFEKDNVEFVACEAGGKGIESGEHGAVMRAGEDGVLHGMKSKFLQSKEGMIKDAHSIAPGLDYPGIGPQLAHYAKTGRCRVEAVTDAEAVKAFRKLCRLEGILPAIESSHAIAQVLKEKFEKEDLVVVCLSGRGDKDLDIVRDYDDT